MTFDPPRKRRHPGRWIAAGLILGAAVAITVKAMPGTAAPDYRDPAQLSRAVQAAERAKGVSADGADCARLAGSDYTCAVASADGTMGSYRVTVSPDGRSWSLTP